MILWIDRTLALAIHERQMAEHGGGTGVRDEALLESALAKPQQLFAYGDPPPDLAALAASLAFGLARNHPFVDGNKRTAHVAYRVFLALNDAELEASSEEKYLHMLSLAEGSVTEAEFADWLRPRVRVQPKHKVNEGKARQRR
ncbi:MAG: type II toxin-antitoxin system death-on-curing family toxin [Thermomonas sp.]|uniref:type II toxin-antitoxin system death-on-curing family toxin n=1 Tax=Thermomonas sp. TaxID=1971895 RepID=UPI001B74F9F1|nr:type II toxin-antitoxin system death-on-curing family toxin [Thermomonas sp.]MBP7788034.1 type II toxin-antitoxin system death-on-curing family toxin [Thermomonas sp.]MBP8615454.1 type II toxin-antitoxin system death-on-curing family toxin [Thermomonas sp.]MBP8648957.1 type II toxin-antitoxin system death-on-curing family toxin [Thermomonas sp.]MBP9696451.1 type II toxin-antitoxin system death-on-curing family toxin [Thermomonas sp.]